MNYLFLYPEYLLVTLESQILKGHPHLDINLSNPEFPQGPFLNPATDLEGNITHYFRHENAFLLDFQRDGVFLGNFTPRDLYREMVQSMVCPDVIDIIDYPVF